MGQLPSRKSPTIAAATSDPGMTFAARHCRYNVCNGSGAINDLQVCVGNVSRLHAATQALGIITRALASTMIIAVETEAAAMAKWKHYKAGTGLEAIARGGRNKPAATRRRPPIRVRCTFGRRSRYRRTDRLHRIQPLMRSRQRAAARAAA